MYKAIVLDKESRDYIIRRMYAREACDEDLEIVAHHITICMGTDKKKKYPFEVGEDVEFTISHLGTLYAMEMGDKQPEGSGNTTRMVVAAKVVLPEGKFVKNQTPHVTLMVNRQMGAKPVYSNYITNWNLLNDDRVFKGTVEICE